MEKNDSARCPSASAWRAPGGSAPSAPRKLQVVVTVEPGAQVGSGHFKERGRAAEVLGVFRKLDPVQDFRDFECAVGKAGGKLLSIFKALGLQSSQLTDCTGLRSHGVVAPS